MWGASILLVWGKPKFSLNHRQILTRQISVHTGKFLKDF
jgi:hypothetical protein